MGRSPLGTMVARKMAKKSLPAWLEIVPAQEAGVSMPEGILAEPRIPGQDFSAGLC